MGRIDLDLLRAFVVVVVVVAVAEEKWWAFSDTMQWIWSADCS